MRRCEFCDSPVPADATICPVCKEEIAEETLERILPLLKRPDAPDVREMGVKDRLWGVLRRPAAAYRDIGRRPDAAGPMLIIIANALVLFGFFLAISSKFTVTVTINATSGQTADVSVLSSIYGPQVILAGLATILPYMMLGMFYLIVGGAFAHLAFKITGGTGGKQKSVAIVGYSMLPVVLIRIAAVFVILSSLPAFDANLASQYGLIIDQIYQSPSWLTIDLMTVGAFFWTGFLLIFGIREAHDTSTMWAAFVSLACMIVLIWTFWQVH
ncbi:MAG: YIP1 family protein [Candidatus Thorarchaeota archaeon]